MEEGKDYTVQSRPDSGFGTRNQVVPKPEDKDEEDGLTRLNRKLHEKGPVEPKRMYNDTDEKFYGPAIKREAVKPKKKEEDEEE